MASRRSIPVSAGACCAPLLSDPLKAKEAERLATVFAALADPTRLRLLSLIATSGSGEVCACDLVAAVAKSQPTVSHHLKILREAGLLDSERRGTWIWYRMNRSRVEELRESLT